MSKIVPFIAARWFSSCHDESYLLAKETTEENLGKICSSYCDVLYRSTMA
jgi:hypothetical protein